MLSKYRIPVYLVNGAYSPLFSPSEFQPEFYDALVNSARAYDFAKDQAMTSKAKATALISLLIMLAGVDVGLHYTTPETVDKVVQSTTLYRINVEVLNQGILPMMVPHTF